MVSAVDFLEQKLAGGVVARTIDNNLVRRSDYYRKRQILRVGHFRRPANKLNVLRASDQRDVRAQSKRGRAWNADAT